MNEATRVLKVMGRERGKKTEERFFEAVRGSFLKEMPDWFLYVLHATKEEDAKGIDAVVVTDVGKLFVQIKSSQAGARKFETSVHRRRNSYIGCVVICEGDTPEMIRSKTRKETAWVRQKILADRPVWD